MKIANELLEKFNKYSAAQLVAKIEKTTDEAEKEAIISILKKRGKDVQAYEGKSTAEIGAEAAIDEKQKKEAGKAAKEPKAPKAEKAPKEKKEKTSGKKAEIFFEDEKMPKGAQVKILNESTKVKAGETGTVVKTGHWDNDPEAKFVYIKLDSTKKVCSRMYKFVELV